MTREPQTIEIRRLGLGDEEVVRALAEAEPQTALLTDERTVFVAAFDGGAPVGFAFGYALPRRHGLPETFFVYEVSVDEPYRRRGVGRRLMEELLADREDAFVLTEPDNDAANALYAALGGRRSDAVMWEW
ncbi:MAG TPA: GNAT family N-acetyltransferase [Gaiellaceae bacterium]|nr:GNAT family N-acetyltransferase [Gaiellaceae bacterium]